MWSDEMAKKELLRKGWGQMRWQKRVLIKIIFEKFDATEKLKKKNITFHRSRTHGVTFRYDVVNQCSNEPLGYKSAKSNILSFYQLSIHVYIEFF